LFVKACEIVGMSFEKAFETLCSLDENSLLFRYYKSAFSAVDPVLVLSKK
jgi:hypothetical protein